MNKNNSYAYVIYILIVMFLTACSTTQHDKASITKSTEAQTLTYVNASSFDNDLSQALASIAGSVTLNVVSSVSLDDIPERLDKWLAVVKETDGKVEPVLEPSAEKGIEMFLIKEVFTRGYKYLKKKKMYGPAKEYDTKIFYDGSNGQVTKILFELR